MAHDDLGDSHPSKKHRSSSHRDRHDERDEKRHRSSRDDRERSSHSSSSRRDKSSSSHSHRHRSSRRDEKGDEDEWVEKDAPPAPSAAALAPPPVDTVGTFTVGEIRREDSGALQPLSGAAMTDGYGEGDVGEPGGTGGGEMDLFSAMGTERKRREPKEKVDPTVRLSPLLGLSREPS